MEKTPIDPIEIAIIETVCALIKPQLTRIVSSLPEFNHRRIAYFLIEASDVLFISNHKPLWHVFQELLVKRCLS